jgi:hypothetical protein
MARTSPVAGAPATQPSSHASADGATAAPPAAPPPTAPPAAPPASGWQRLRHWLLDRRESFANVVIVLLLAGGGLFVFFRGPTVTATHAASQNPAAAVPASACTGKKATHPVKVNDASGTAGTMNLFVGRGGNLVQRQSAPLGIENGTLAPGTYLCTSVSDLVRSDGETLPANQVASWGRVTNDGAHVTVYVVTSPRYRQVSGFGGYTGTVALNDPRAVGGNIAVDVHAEYPYLDDVILFALLAAFGGFIWARLIHVAVSKAAVAHGFWVALVLRTAVLLATAVPVINAQVLSNPDWAGDLGRYITLATLAGGAAIALTPTLNTLLDRALSSGSN